MKLIDVSTNNWIPIKAHASKGFQRKWYNKEENLFLKEELKYTYPAKDYFVEEISTALLRQLNYTNIRYANYEACEILLPNGVCHGCLSPNFLKDTEKLINFGTLYQIVNPGGIIESDNVVETLLHLQQIFLYFGVEWYNDYLAIMFLLDYLLVNPDRHKNNISLIYNSVTKTYSLAPLFDFGYGLLQCGDIPRALPLEEKLKYLSCAPFDKPFDMILELYMYQGYIQKYIPSVLDVSGLIFPERDSLVLFLRQCKKLGITVIRDRRK